MWRLFTPLRFGAKVSCDLEIHTILEFHLRRWNFGGEERWRRIGQGRRGERKLGIGTGTGKIESWTIEGAKGEGKFDRKARKNRREAHDAEARKHESRNQGCGFAEKNGAEERTRTSTGKPPLDPEPSASTSSATSAQIFLQSRPTVGGKEGLISFNGCGI